MFPAVCAACGRETQVPFEPRNGRPVYCSDCFSRSRA
jgi:CxxC-x17-CxxC domain-containing protein